MTVLFVAASKNEGVVFAADGLQVFENGNPPIENGQKIWEAKSLHDDSIMCGCYGNCRITRTDEKVFSFQSYADFVISTLDVDHYACDPRMFLGTFADKMRAELQRFLMNYSHEQSTVKLKPFIASIALAWYCQGQSFFGCACFTHENGVVFAAVRPYRADMDDLTMMVGGSPTIYNRGVSPISTIEDAITAAKRFAQECVDNKTILPDCTDFGGKVHVGVLRESGFSWDTEPCPMKSR
jgi:hypothetical protein